jgi:hypothetical protein
MIRTGRQAEAARGCLGRPDAPTGHAPPDTEAAKGTGRRPDVQQVAYRDIEPFKLGWEYRSHFNCSTTHNVHFVYDPLQPGRHCASQTSVSGQVVDRAIPHSPVDDAPRELTTTRDGRFFGGVGARAAEGPQARVAANQEIKGPASGATDLKRARRDGEALVRDGIQLQPRAEES